MLYRLVVAPDFNFKVSVSQTWLWPKSDLEQFILSLKPMHRRGTPAEVAEAVIWLSSDAASFVTGHTMVVDGGMRTL